MKLSASQAASCRRHPYEAAVLRRGQTEVPGEGESGTDRRLIQSLTPARSEFPPGASNDADLLTARSAEPPGADGRRPDIPGTACGSPRSGAGSGSRGSPRWSGGVAPPAGFLSPRLPFDGQDPGYLRNLLGCTDVTSGSLKRHVPRRALAGGGSGLYRLPKPAPAAGFRHGPLQTLREVGRRRAAGRITSTRTPDTTE